MLDRSCFWTELRRRGGIVGPLAILKKFLKFEGAALPGRLLLEEAGRAAIVACNYRREKPLRARELTVDCLELPPPTQLPSR